VSNCATHRVELRNSASGRSRPPAAVAADPPGMIVDVMSVLRARIGVSVVFAVCGAGFATWAARVPAAQQRLGLDAGQLAVGVFGLAAGAVLALLAAGPVLAPSRPDLRRSTSRSSCSASATGCWTSR
jgi:hypothetical protein